MRGRRGHVASRWPIAAYRADRSARRGSVLIIVLILIMLLTYGIYGFTHRMMAEQRAAAAYAKKAQAKASAVSGIHLAASLIDLRGIQTANPITLYNRPDLFAGIITYDGTETASIGHVSIIAPVPTDLTASQVRYGLFDESAKLNLNAIVTMGAAAGRTSTTGGAQSAGSKGNGAPSGGRNDGGGTSGGEEESPEDEEESSPSDSSEPSEAAAEDEESSGGGAASSRPSTSQTGILDEKAQRKMLMGLPGMTQQLADAILDYVDPDQIPREYGAESAHYQSLAVPYLANDAPLKALDQLLMVRGVTPMLLYGEDANRNGLLDPSENDGAATPPVDNADGMLQLGWRRFLTVHSAESNLRPGGLPKININQQKLATLYDAIMAQTGNKQVAKFVVAYRMYGPASEDDSGGSGGNGRSRRGSDRDDEGQNDDTRRQEDDDSDRGDRQSDESDRESGDRSERGGSEGGDEKKIMRGGLDLSAGPQVQIKSLYALVDVKVEIPAEDEDSEAEPETLTSPWTSANILTDFPMLVQLFALSNNKARIGRINVNQARLEVLIGISGMTPQMAQSIVAARAGAASQTMALNPARRTTAWLVARGLVDLQTMKALDRYLTAGGDVFRVQAVGFFEGGGPTTRLEAIIDGTVYPAKIISYRNLTELGQGYSQAQLLPLQGSGSPAL